MRFGRVFLWTAILFLPLAIEAQPEKLQAPQPLKLSSPNNISKLQGLVQPPDKGPSRLILTNGVSGKQLEVVNQPLFFVPEVRWHGEEYLEIKLWKSPSESTTVFYDLIQERASQPIANVLSVDTRKMVVANVDDNTLRLVKVFDVEKSGAYSGANSFSLDANFPQGRPLLDVIKLAEFTPDGDFVMRYEVKAKVQMGVRVSADQISF